MNRIEFTSNLASLLRLMIEQGETPILDYVKRSKEEQFRLFANRKSNCDGSQTVSAHQYGRAADIYFQRNGNLTDPVKKWEHWHDIWELWGGKPMIDWDKGHFEG